MNINELKPNPNNPRIIRDFRFKQLVKSLQEFPEMASVREIVVNKDNVILGGNMRFRAMQEAGWTDVPVRVVDWSEEKQKEFVVKDNANYGEWDFAELANQYDTMQLTEWGLDIPNFDKIDYGKEWGGMPEFEQENMAFKSLVIRFENQENVDKFAALIGQDISESNKSLWFPPQERRDAKNTQYVAEDDNA